MHRAVWRRSAAIVAALSLGALLSAADGETLTAKEFAEPDNRYRPWTIWWWMGNASPVDDLRADLAEMAKAGFGGAQIFPIYPLAEDDPSRGVESTPLYSDLWFEKFGAILETAKTENIQLFVHAGSGWPLGGPRIPPEMSSKSVARGLVHVRGPQDATVRLPAPDADPHWTVEAVERIVAVGRGGNKILVEPVINDERFRWAAPPGEWRIHVIYRMRTGQENERGGSADTGLVLDHFNAAALDLQLDQLLPIRQALQQSPNHTFAGFTADSLELEDSNWTDGLLAEFESRIGYDLAPYLPDLWDWLAPVSGAVRQDFLRTLSDLMMERYFRRFADRSRELGGTAMVQAHGAIADVIQAYGQLGIPDVETMWTGSWRQDVNLRSRRIGVSASHIYGKPIVAAESYTWLNAPRFTVTLEQMKAATDALFIDGVNQIKAHGFTSSPQAVGKPGWVFYASTMVNQNQTWWPHLGRLNRYIARMQYLMQSATYVADVALYHNLDDARISYDRPKPAWQQDHAWRRRERDPGIDSAAMIAETIKPCADRLQQAGYGFDVVNDDALLHEMDVRGNTFEGHGLRYKAIVFCETESIPLATLRRVQKLVDGGGIALAVGRMPKHGVGLREYQDQAGAVADTIRGIWNGDSAFLAKDLAEMADILNSKIGPDFEAIGDARVGFIHRRTGDQNVYFVANAEPEATSAILKFRDRGPGAEQWNPMDGAVRRAESRKEAGEVVFPVQLGPYESMVFVFGLSDGVPQDPPQTSGRLLPVDGPWTVTFPEPVGRTLTWRRLADWANVVETEAFSGIASYQTSIRLPDRFDPADPIELDLGQVHESAEVLVNGVSAGVLIMRPYNLRIERWLRPGLNEIEVRVANLWNNHILSMPKTVSTVPGPGYGLTEVLYGPSERRRMPSGLLGPVHLIR